MTDSPATEFAELATLLGRVRTQCGFNDRDHEFCSNHQARKVYGDIQPGSNLRITWAETGAVDRGYVFTLPGHEQYDVWMGGIVHIPHPDNPGGKDSPPSVWMTLDDLLRNDQLESITVLVVQPPH